MAKNSGTNEILRDVFLLNESIGVAVGRNGTIIWSKDGGQVWETQESNTSNTLQGVAVTDENTAIVVGGTNVRGSFGIALKTTDAGATWIPRETGPSTALHDVKFIDGKIGYSVGEKGIVLNTQNGGENWQNLGPSTFEWLEAVDFEDDNNGVAVGQNGTILQTSDGGMTWLDRSIDTVDELYDVQFADETTVFAVGHTQIAKSTDRGLTWESLSLPDRVRYNGVAFVDANTGTIVGGNGTIFRTENGGDIWVRQNSNAPSGSLRAVNFTDSDTGTIVGTDGIILRTTDAGKNWISQSTTLRALLHDVHFIDTNQGVIVGASGVILLTTDGGENWIRRESDTTTRLEGVSFLNGIVGYAVGGSGEILLTVDGGHTWVKESCQITQETLRDVSFKPGGGAVVVGRDGNIIAHSGDGITSVNDEKDDLQPKIYFLGQNYPNPFNPETTIRYDLPAPSNVRISIYNILGQRVWDTAHEEPAGYHEVVWQGTNSQGELVSSGVYFYRMIAGKFTHTRKMLLIR